MIELFHSMGGAGPEVGAWAALIDDDALIGFSQDATDNLIRAGEIHVGALRTIDRTRGLGIVLLAGGQEAMLDLPRGGTKLHEGARLLVQVQRPARGTKRAKVTTRIVLEGRAASLVLTESLERRQIDPQNGPNAGAVPAAECDQLIQMTEAIREAATRASGPTRIRCGRGCVADLLFRFPDALPTIVRSNTRNGADQLRQLLGEDPVGCGVDVEHVPSRDWRYSPSDLLDMIGEAFETRHGLRSGGSLLIERGETLTAIDVNSGTTDSNSGPERVAIETNREATAEIVRWVRCLNLAGNIVIDYVGLRARGERRALVDRLRAGFAPDPARPWIGAMSPIGLVEMSRQSLGPGPVERPTGGEAGCP